MRSLHVRNDLRAATALTRAATSCLHCHRLENNTGKIEVETREEMGESFKKCLTVLLFIYTPCNEVNLFCFWKMVFQLQHTFCTYTCTCIPRCRCPVCHFKKFVAHTHMHTYSQYIHCWWCAATAKNIDRERH